MGIWEKADAVNNEYLQTLVDSLPSVVQASRAPSTVTKYEAGWKKWLSWTEHKAEVRHIPADPFFVSLYLVSVLKEHGTKGALSTAMFSIRWAHHRAGFESPTEDPFVQLVFDGCERICGKPAKKKEPITTPMVRSLIDKFSDSADLKVLRFLTMVVLCFTGFLRIEEILEARIQHLVFFQDRVEITLPRCKNDQIREGNVVPIARLDSAYCPVALSEKFINLCGTSTIPNAYLLPRMVNCKTGLKAHTSRGISYTTARESFKEYMKLVSPDVHTFSTHSMRAGGASEAASSGIDGRLISKHGRWKTTKARDGYIKDSIENRLKITRALGL